MIKEQFDNKKLLAELNSIFDVNKAKVQMKELESQLFVLSNSLEDDNLKKTIVDTFKQCKKGNMTFDEVVKKFDSWQQKLK